MKSGGVGVGVGVGMGMGAGDGVGFGGGAGVVLGAGVGVRVGAGAVVPAGAEQLATIASRTGRKRTRCTILRLADTSCLPFGTGALPRLFLHYTPPSLFCVK